MSKGGRPTPRCFRSTRKDTTTGRDSGKDELRELLRIRSEELNQKALKEQGEIPPEHLAALERLAKAVRIAEDLLPNASRWPPTLALAASLFLVSLLLLIRIPETQVTLDAVVSELSFTLPLEKPILSRASVARLGVSGLSGLSISPDIVADLAGTPYSNVVRAIRLTVPSDCASKCSINTAALIPPAGTRAWLSQAGAPRSYRLSLKPPKQGHVTLRAAGQGQLEVAAPEVLTGVKLCDFGQTGATFDFVSGEDIMDVDFVLNENSDLQFYAQVPIERLDLVRIEELATPEKSVVAPISTVLSGTLYLESLEGEKYELRPGEHLRLASLRGRMETLRLEGNRISFNLRGRVRGIQVGEEGTGRNLMPNLLQWLKARQPLSLLWGSAAFVYGLTLTVMKWYRRSHED